MKLIKRIYNKIEYDFFLEAKWFIQRGRRGYSDRDAWGICEFLAEILPPMLERLKTGDGYCGSCESEEEWNGKLDIMIAGFEAGLRTSNLDYDYDHEEPEQLIEMIKKDDDIFNAGMDVFKEYYWGLWD